MQSRPKDNDYACNVRVVETETAETETVRMGWRVQDLNVGVEPTALPDKNDTPNCQSKCKRSRFPGACLTKIRCVRTWSPCKEWPKIGTQQLNVPYSAYCTSTKVATPFGELTSFVVATMLALGVSNHAPEGRSIT
jgi:hypothetical protein